MPVDFNYPEQPADSQGPVTTLLNAFASGDRSALNSLISLVHPELHEIARRYVSREKREHHALQATALIHEAYLRMVGSDGSEWKNRTCFFAVAAKIMRHVLVDHARARIREKRGGGVPVLSLDEVNNAAGVVQTQNVEVLELHDALDELAAFDSLKSQIIELRFFGGLTEQEVSEFAGVPLRTVQREWSLARAWMYRRLKGVNL